MNLGQLMEGIGKGVPDRDLILKSEVRLFINL